MGVFKGDIKEYWGGRPQYCLIGPPRIPLQDSQVPVSTSGLFHTLDIYTLPNGQAIILALFGDLELILGP